MWIERALIILSLVLAATFAAASELVMVTRAGCSWCERWDREVAPGYRNSEEGQRLPLHKVSLDEGQPKYALKEPVRYTPTFLLIDQGQEVGRITGYLDNAMFWGQLNVLLAQNQPPAERNSK